MKRIILATVAMLVAISPQAALAKKEVQTTRTVWELSDFPELATKAKAVCGNSATKSPKLQIACKAEAWPSVTKAGAFRDTGIGAELNTLMRQ